MSRRQYSLMIVFLAAVVFLGGSFALKVLADGFVDKVVQIDGINAQGTIDDQNNLAFLGLGLWNGPVKLAFSPSVLTDYSLGATVETETGEIMGKYAVRFHLAPKSGDVNNQNLKITVVDHWGTEVESEVMLTAEASGVAIEVATTKKPYEFRISYSPSP
jgi:hypothetical protein